MPQGAVATFSDSRPLDSYQLPVSAFDPAVPFVETVEGRVSTRTFTVDGNAANTLALMQSFRAQITANGYSVLLDCNAATCGGFDFRFAIAVTPAPAMEVDLTDYRFLSAQKQAGSDNSYVSILISRTQNAAWLQFIDVLPSALPAVELAPEPAAVPDSIVTETEIGIALATIGRFALDGLEFASGRAELAADPQDVLGQLAKWMGENPAASLILVGHTDNEGSLESNIAMSRRRAEVVQSALIAQHSVAASRLSVDGVGFLVPRADNATAEGRAMNRRVEAVVR